MLAVFQVLVCWPPHVSAWCAPWCWRIASAPVDAAFRKQAADTYLHKWLSDSMLKTAIEAFVPVGQKVFSFAGRPESYIDRDIVVSYESTLGNLANDALWTAQAHAPAVQLHFKMLPVTTRAIRVVNMAAAEDFWTIAELRLYSQGRELTRSPDWRLSAKPNGWEVQLAFDNNYATRWSTWQAMSPGDHIEVDFPTPQTVDEVALECDPVAEAKPEIHVLQAGGRWVPITNTAEVVKKALPPGIRRAAVNEVKALGFHYILLNEGDLLYGDVARNLIYWGLTELARVNGTHFYRID
jgi:hypothetical protein